MVCAGLNVLTRALCLDEDPDLYAVEVRYAGVAAVRYDEAGVYRVTAGLYVDVAGEPCVRDTDVTCVRDADVTCVRDADVSNLLFVTFSTLCNPLAPLVRWILPPVTTALSPLCPETVVEAWFEADDDTLLAVLVTLTVCPEDCGEDAWPDEDTPVFPL